MLAPSAPPSQSWLSWEVSALPLVLALDVALCVAFDLVGDDRGEIVLANGLLLWGLVRVVVNVLTLLLCLRWGIVNRHLQAEGLAAAYAVLSTPELKRPLLRRLSRTGEDRTPEMDAYRARRRAELWRTLLIGGAFLFNTSVSVYIAIRCVFFEYGPEKLQAIILFGIITTASCEFYVLKRACDAVTKVRGHLLPVLHRHKLYFWPTLPFHSCDICKTRVLGKGYRCKRCDFDVCHQCFRHAIRDADATATQTAARLTRAWRQRGGPEAEDPQPSVAERQALLPLAWEQLGPHVPQLALAVLFLFGFAVAKLGLPNFQGSIVDAVFQSDIPKFQREVVRLALCSAMLVGCGIVRDSCIALVGRRISTQVRNELFTAMVSQDVEFFDRSMSGHLTASITSDVNAMVSPWKPMLTNMLGNAFVIAGGMLFCLLTSWRLTAISLTTLLPMTYVASVYARWSTRINREIWSGISDANSVATETLQNIRTVKAFGTEAQEIERFVAATGNALAKGIKDSVGSAAINAVTEHLSVTGTVLVLGFGGWEAIRHHDTLSAGDLVTFQLYWMVVVTAYRELNSHMNEASRAQAATLRVLAMLADLRKKPGPGADMDAGADAAASAAAESTHGPTALDSPVPLSTHEGLEVRFRDVTFRYPSSLAQGLPQLRAVSLTFEPWRVTVLAGRSGAGKSTIVNLLCRFYEPEGGSITINGTPLSNLNVAQLRREIGVVSQDTPLFGTSILDNLVYGLDPTAVSMEDVMAAAEAAHAHDFIMETKYGYQTRLGERGVQCSQGERARLSIARALLRRPSLLLLDEPTANLDTESQRLVQGAVHNLVQARRATVVLITHKNSSFIRQVASRIYVIDRGCVVEEGTYGELACNPTSLYHHLFCHDEA